MADLECLICDYVVPVGNAEDEVLALLGTGSPDAGRLLVTHMESHTLADWVRAFKMADAYIERLEGEISALKARPAVPVAPAAPPAPQATFTPPADYAQQLLSPHEVADKQRRAQARARILAHNPDETLIPRIPDAMRPEGVVGVKY